VYRDIRHAKAAISPRVKRGITQISCRRSERLRKRKSLELSKTGEDKRKTLGKRKGAKRRETQITEMGIDGAVQQNMGHRKRDSASRAVGGRITAHQVSMGQAGVAQA
jgi:hypothetical protein